jgi:3-oxoacyl-[acyl-carrier-protein] synthase-1
VRRLYTNMNRVVITGLGVVSSIGQGVGEVLESLREGRCGMAYMPEMKELGYRCCVYAPLPDLDTSSVPPALLPNMSTAALLTFLTAQEAIGDAHLSAGDLASPTVGAIIGTGGGCANCVPGVEEAVRSDPESVDPYAFAKIMNCGHLAILASHWSFQGRCSSLSAACTTGSYNIGYAYELLRYGKAGLDICLAGSAEEDLWRQVGLSADNSVGMPTDYNDRPSEACRPFDRDRQGLVMSAGSGVLVLETLVHAERRGARVYAEIVGYGAANDGEDMFVPSGVGLRHVLRQTLKQAQDAGVGKIDYINPHGAGTPQGDRVEADVLREFFGSAPMVSSTKATSGHAQGGTASQEAVYATLMLHHSFVAPTLNLTNVAPECQGIDHVRFLRETPLHTALTLNSGLGGSNGCLALRKL